MGHHNKPYHGNGRAKKQQKRRGYINCHHLIWQRKDWSEEYAHKLRELACFKVYIPAETLHKLIHEEMWGIPCPNEVICRIVYDEVMGDLSTGKMMGDKWNSVLYRLEYLAEKFEALAPLTAKAIRVEKRIIELWYRERRRQ